MVEDVRAGYEATYLISPVPRMKDLASSLRYCMPSLVMLVSTNSGHMQFTRTPSVDR